jgi:hypothetical protein
MNRSTQQHDNPLARVALAAPPALGRAMSIGGRAAGAAFAIAVAAGQSFERTRALAVVIAVLALVSLLPVPRQIARRLPWPGAGVVFFGGALLAPLAGGILMVAAGAVAALGAAIDDRHAGRMTGVPSFFTGFGLMAVAVVAIVLGIEG